MLYVVVELPHRTKFNPFATPAIFDIFQEVKSRAKTTKSPLISYNSDLEDVQNHINRLSKTARFLLLTMSASTRYGIDTRQSFIETLLKAEFQVGVLRREVKWSQTIINSPAVVPPVATKQNIPAKISIPSQKRESPFAAQIQKHLESSGLPKLQMTGPKHPFSTKPIAPQPVKIGNKAEQASSVKPVLPPVKAAKPAPHRVNPIPNPAPIVVPQVVIPEPNRVEPVNPPVVQEIVPELPKNLPFEHIPAPDEKLVKAAHDVAAKLGDDLPIDCLDPISMEVLSDPIEVNRRVYDRDTVVNLVKDGKFHDPFTNQQIELATIKPAHFMLDAMVEHKNVLNGEKPLLLEKHAKTDCISLQGIFEQWEKMLQAPKQEMQ